MNWYRTFLKLAQTYDWGMYGGWVAPDGTATSVTHHAAFFTGQTGAQTGMRNHYDAFGNGYMRVVNPMFVPYSGQYEVYIETPDKITTEQLAFAEKILGMTNKMSRSEPRATKPPAAFVEKFDVVGRGQSMNIQQALAFLRSIVGQSSESFEQVGQQVGGPSQGPSSGLSSGMVSGVSR
jgi:hypothetical protein